MDSLWLSVPLIFLVAFWAIYRNDPVPLALHVGQFLTVTVLGGACFGLPLQSWANARWVWRRYVLAPVPRSTFVISILAARYVLLIIAALLQLALVWRSACRCRCIVRSVAWLFAGRLAFMAMGW